VTLALREGGFLGVEQTVGRIDADGTVRRPSGSLSGEEVVGRVSPTDGAIFRVSSSFNGEDPIGRVDRDGTVYRTNDSFSGDEVAGRVDPGGTVFRAGGSFGADDAVARVEPADVHAGGATLLLLVENEQPDTVLHDVLRSCQAVAVGTGVSIVGGVANRVSPSTKIQRRQLRMIRDIGESEVAALRGAEQLLEAGHAEAASDEAEAAVGRLDAIRRENAVTNQDVSQYAALLAGLNRVLTIRADPGLAEHLASNVLAVVEELRGGVFDQDARSLEAFLYLWTGEPAHAKKLFAELAAIDLSNDLYVEMQRLAEQLIPSAATYKAALRAISLVQRLSRSFQLLAELSERSAAGLSELSDLLGETSQGWQRFEAAFTLMEEIDALSKQEQHARAECAGIADSAKELREHAPPEVATLLTRSLDGMDERLSAAHQGWMAQRAILAELRNTLDAHSRQGSRAEDVEPLAELVAASREVMEESARVAGESQVGVAALVAELEGEVGRSQAEGVLSKLNGTMRGLQHARSRLVDAVEAVDAHAKRDLSGTAGPDLVAMHSGLEKQIELLDDVIGAVSRIAKRVAAAIDSSRQ
jgi:hypothetical protein